MDDGYYDMYKIMKALQGRGYDGIVILITRPAWWAATTRRPPTGTATCARLTAPTPKPSANKIFFGHVENLRRLRLIGEGSGNA